MTQKKIVEVWKVSDIEVFGGKEQCIGTFKTIKEFALNFYDKVKDEKYQRSYIENADEQIIFDYLDEFNLEVIHVCNVDIDEFNVKQKDYTTNI